MLDPVTGLIRFDPSSRDMFLRPYGARSVAADAAPRAPRMLRGRRLPRNVKVLRPVRANAGIQAAYRGQLEDLISEMHESVTYWVEAKYKNNEPRVVALAGDAAPSEVLRSAVAGLAKRWQDKFDEAADRLAKYFATAVEDRSSRALKKILKDGGWTVRFTMTPAMRDVFDATVNANVALIKSIPEQYLGGVEQLVQQSVQRGGDRGLLAKQLQEKYGVTKRRAALIARDQNNKANATFQKVRQLELGITDAIWMHSHGGEVPRPTHVAMNGKPYKIAEGKYDSAEGRNVMPGELINCRCASRPIVSGFS
jgi:SPP1 gp7 family putative phage head morphogenesis protein